MELFALLMAMTPEGAKDLATQKHILIVDDDRDARAQLAATLERSGYRVTTTARGTAMQRALERAGIELVVLDVCFTEDDGMRACRSLRATSEVPFVIVARRADEVDRILGLEMGADDYLAKPVNSRELLARMRNILRRANGVSAAPATRARLFRFGGWQLDIVARELSDPHGK